MTVHNECQKLEALVTKYLSIKDHTSEQAKKVLNQIHRLQRKIEAAS